MEGCHHKNGHREGFRDKTCRDDEQGKSAKVEARKDETCKDDACKAHQKACQGEKAVSPLIECALPPARLTIPNEEKPQSQQDGLAIRPAWSAAKFTTKKLIRFADRRAAVAHQAQVDQFLGDLLRLGGFQGAGDFVHEQFREPPAGAVQELTPALPGERLA